MGTITVIQEDFRDYLGFKVKLDGLMVYGRYVVSCVGLSDLPLIFSKIFRVLVKHWRASCIMSIMVLDDGAFL